MQQRIFREDFFCGSKLVDNLFWDLLTFEIKFSIFKPKAQSTSLFISSKYSVIYNFLGVDFYF